MNSRAANIDVYEQAHTLQYVGLGIVAVTLCMMTAGCGYSREAIYPSDVRTVAVPIFENRSLYRDVQFDLTEALVKQIELRTPYKVVDRDVADTVLTGEVVRVRQDVLSRRESGGLPQELELRITVHVQWIDARSGDVLRSRRGLEAVGRYIPARPVGQPLEFGRHAAVERLADRIVDLMRADW